VPVFDRPYRETEKANATASEKLIFNAVIRKLLDRMVSDLVENTSKRVARPLRPRPSMTSAAFPNGWPCSATKSEAERAQTKAFLYENLYSAGDLDCRKRCSPSG